MAEPIAKLLDAWYRERGQRTGAALRRSMGERAADLLRHPAHLLDTRYDENSDGSRGTIVPGAPIGVLGSLRLGF